MLLKLSLRMLLVALLLVPPATAHPTYRLVVDTAGRVFLIDWPTRRVLVFEADGSARTYADFTALGVESHPHAIALDAQGRLHVAETYGRRIWIVDEDGQAQLHPWCGRLDDGHGVVQDIHFGPKGRLHLVRRREGGPEAPKGTVYRIERVETGGEITELLVTREGDLGLYAACFAVASDGSIWITSDARILRVRGGRVEVVAGGEDSGFMGGPGRDARLRGAWGVASRDAGGVVFADEGNRRVRSVDADGRVRTVAGSGERGNRDGSAASASFDGLYQVAEGSDGRVYAAEVSGRPARHRIRVIAGGEVTTLAEIPVGDPARARTLGDFERISKANARRFSHQAMTGLDPVRDWPLTLWVERSLNSAATHERPLLLSGTHVLSVAEAAALARFRGNRVFLRDLRTLTPETALRLADSGFELYLDGLAGVTPELARALVSSRGRMLSLGGLRELDSETARILARFPKGLRLHGVRRLSEATARELARWEGYGEMILLSLGGLEVFEPEIARALASCPGWGLALDGLKSLTPESARALGSLRAAYLSLDGLESVAPEVAEVISGWQRKFLTLNGVTSVAREVRRDVEAGCETVSFRSLKRQE